MKCINCFCCKKGWFPSKPNEYVCIGVKEPFVIDNINVECTEYPENRNKVSIEDAINHFKHGITHDIFSEPVITYAKMAVEALEKQISKKSEEVNIMTKQEAIELENKCDELMSRYINDECQVSLSLSGKLKIIFNDNYVVFDKELRKVDYISYTGFYQDLMDVIHQAFFCIYDHKSMFDKLIWSYEHVRELE